MHFPNWIFKSSLVQTPYSLPSGDDHSRFRLGLIRVNGPPTPFRLWEVVIFGKFSEIEIDLLARATKAELRERQRL